MPAREARYEGSLVAFFLLTFAVTWPSFLAAAALARGAAPVLAGLRTPVLYLGVFAPAFVALGLTLRSSGKAGTIVLLRRLFAWRVSAGWYLFAAGYMAAIKLTAAVVIRVTSGAWPRFGDTPWFLMLIATILSVVMGGQIGEEIGWRGYALPRLAARFGMAWASVILGAFWAVWHLPLFFFPGADTQGQSFPLYVVQVTALSIAIAWLYLKTNGSLLLTMLMHAAVNNTKDVVPSVVAGATNPFALSTSAVAWVTCALLWTCAAYFLWRMRGVVSC
jgi:membrane protease YdiL (CAAX protease family)